MKNRLLVQLSIILITLSTFLGLFYFFSLRPKLVLPKQLLETERTLAKTHLNLLQNRLGIMSLVSLDTNSLSLATDKSESLSKALEAIKQGVEQLDAPERIQPLPGDEIDFLKELNEQVPVLMEESKEVYEKQKGYLEQIEKISTINNNIFAYNPLYDLGLLDINEEKDALIERTENAIAGLETIKEKLIDYNEEKTVEHRSELAKTQSLLTEQLNYLKNNQLTDAGRIFDAVVEQFEALRNTGLEMELEIIKSQEMITLLTDQTNLILKYEFWLNKIDNAQKELSKIDLDKIF